MKKVFFVSLGCDKNLVDSQIMLGLLRDEGYEPVSSEDQADIIIVNTCSFIGDALDESIETLLEMARQKEYGSCKVLLAAGCLAQRYQKEILDEMPEVDGILGTSCIHRINEVVSGAINGERPAVFADINDLPCPRVKRVTNTGSFSEYLKIADGCGKHCTYCIIPKLRGKYRSYPMEYLLEQARELASAGIKELNLVAQETTMYGVDIYGMKMLPKLLKRLCEIDGIEWIRILYCYPEEITDELLQTMSEEPKICHYLDLPIQHAGDRILKTMGRRTDSRELRNVITRIRRYMPDAAIRTTLISGFPGETQEDHEALKAFVSEMRFDRLGVFTYSREDGTPAALMENQVDEDLKAERRNEIMALQQKIAFAHAQAMTGREIDVIIEGRIPDEGVYAGRTYMDAPEVDGRVFIRFDGELISGEIVRVRIIGASGYDLIAEFDTDQ